ncbi:MAG: PDZ domain-containing protein [Gemmataceae bacterium]|nr:PDZ domain-containing protein [Gemmataceae bacterium]
MRSRWPVLALIGAFCLAPPLWGGDQKAEKKPDAKEPAEKIERKTYHVPYRLTDTQHLLVRVKVNGKGPFNLIVDTGAPLLYLSVPVAQKIGLKVEKKGGDVVVLDRFDIEGGITHKKIKCLVESVPQLRGMNAFGMPGAELHGIIGYTLLANYKMEIDLTRDKMAWTRLDFKPPAPKPLLDKKPKKDEKDPLGDLGGLLEALALLMGKPAVKPPGIRGFLGIELDEKDGAVMVKSVLPKSPAAEAGLKAGDRIREVASEEVNSRADVLRLTARVRAGNSVNLAITRGNDKQEITITTGEGL